MYRVAVTSSDPGANPPLRPWEQHSTRTPDTGGRLLPSTRALALCLSFPASVLSWAYICNMGFFFFPLSLKISHPWALPLCSEALTALKGQTCLSSWILKLQKDFSPQLYDENSVWMHLVIQTKSAFVYLREIPVFAFNFGLD